MFNLFFNVVCPFKKAIALLAKGYAWRLRSRVFIIAGLFHILGILILPYCIGWQFLATGLVMSANLLMFAETQWDMRPPIDNYGVLSEEQKEFNRQQYLIRQTEF